MGRLAALALAAAIAPAPLVAQGGGLVDATDPEALRQLAESFGAAQLDVDDYGDPILIGMMDGTYYAVEFYGCTNGRNCRELLFRAWFETRELTELEMAGWNRNSHFGKVYIDAEGYPAIEMDVILTGGVSEENMTDNFDLWGQALAEFVRYIGWGS